MNFYYGKLATKRRSLVCVDDELQTKKIIKFRLGGRAHSLSLLEFARKLGLYHIDELDEEGFYVYFQGGLHSDKHFNTQGHWLRISQEENLSLSMSHASTIRNPVLRVGRLIPEDPQQGVPRVDIPRPPRASMQDLYERMGSMEIRQGAIGAYNPPGYAQPQYHQYYQ
nr:hypothetical protein [Tanacetum cinerariifolium]GEX69100.1 hypothetical protein [Tanacetum cinerariifolium]